VKVNIGTLLKANGNTFKVDLDSVPDLFKISNQHDKIIDKVCLKGSLENLSETLNFKGMLSFLCEGSCDRCLEKVKASYSVKVEGNFFDSTSVTAEEDYSYNGRELDFSAFIIDNVLLSIPFKHLCDEDCKGLCTHCGINLNQEKCKCKDDNIDPRLLKLKDLLK
jgi:uncharacterized protein